MHKCMALSTNDDKFTNIVIIPKKKVVLIKKLLRSFLPVLLGLQSLPLGLAYDP